MSKEKPTDKVFNRSFTDCSIRAVEGEGNERKFKLSFSSEEPYERFYGIEILSHAEGECNFDRLNNIGVVLFNHDRDKVIGKILNAEVVNNRGEAEIRFDDDEFSEMIYQKVKNETLKGVSVGYRINEFEEVKANKKSKDGKFEGPCFVARNWEAYEVSIVSVPADATVGVGRSDEEIPQPKEETGVSGFYFNEKQLQINQNIMLRR